MSAPVRLSPADYWKARALQRDIEALEHDLCKVRARIAQAKQRAAAQFDELVGRYGLNQSVAYRWDDDTCSLKP